MEPVPPEPLPEPEPPPPLVVGPPRLPPGSPPSLGIRDHHPCLVCVRSGLWLLTLLHALVGGRAGDLVGRLRVVRDVALLIQPRQEAEVHAELVEDRHRVPLVLGRARVLRL